MKANLPVSENEHVSLDQIMRDYVADYVPDTRQWTSSLMKETIYNALSCELTVVFNNDKRYLYKNFLHETYDSFITAPSQGKFFLTQVRDKYKDGENVVNLSKDE
jgi:hypothetical protein